MTVTRPFARAAFFMRTVLLAALVCAAVSCGIEVFIYLYPVIYWYGQPTDTPEYNRFKFRTSDERNTDEAGPYFKGFEIYYRIYNNTSTLTTTRNSINSYNSSNPALAYNNLINTRNYRRLLSGNRTYESPLIPGAADNRIVEIRFFDYDVTPAGVYVRNDPSGVILFDYGIPLRSVRGDDDAYPAPFEFDDIDDGDDDVTWSSTWDDENDKKVYVHAYVLAYGFDASYKQLYSELFDLGYVTIPED